MIKKACFLVKNTNSRLIAVTEIHIFWMFWQIYTEQSQFNHDKTNTLPKLLLPAVGKLEVDNESALITRFGQVEAESFRTFSWSKPVPFNLSKNADLKGYVLFERTPKFIHFYNFSIEFKTRSTCPKTLIWRGMFFLKEDRITLFWSESALITLVLDKLKLNLSEPFLEVNLRRSTCPKTPIWRGMCFLKGPPNLYISVTFP